MTTAALCTEDFPLGKVVTAAIDEGDLYDKPKILCSIPKKAERAMCRSAFLIVRPLKPFPSLPHAVADP